MIIGHLVHARMVFPGNLKSLVNVPKDVSYHVFGVVKGIDTELAITYSKDAAEYWCRKLNGQRIERKKIFKQFDDAQPEVAQVQKAA